MSTLDQLRVFALCVEYGSFTIASKHLNISTTAVSKQITQLEKNLNLTLLQRSTRKLNVTPLGYAVYEKCKSILEDVDLLQEFARSLKTEPQGTLHIFATPMLGEKLIDPLLKNFMELYPQLNIELTIASRSPNFTTGKIDVALGIPSDYINKSHENLVVIPFGESYRVLCASKNYLKKYGCPKNYSEFAKHTYITFKNRPHDYFLENYKFSRIVNVNNWSSILSCLTCGLGIASLSYISVADLIQEGAIETFFPEFHQQIKSIDFVYKKNDYMDPKIIKFKEYFFQHKDLFIIKE